MKGRRVQKVLAAVLAVAMVLPMTAIPEKAEEALSESSGNDVSGWKLHPEKECQCHL